MAWPLIYILYRVRHARDACIFNWVTLMSFSRSGARTATAMKAVSATAKMAGRTTALLSVGGLSVFAMVAHVR